MPAGYIVQSGPGFTIGLSPDWKVGDPGNLSLNATNTSGGHNWQLLLDRNPDVKPADQTFEDYATTQRAKCPGAVPDTIVVPAGSAFICRSDLGQQLSVVGYRLPVGRDVWELALAFRDGKYSGAGQDELETILKTLTLTP